MSKPKISQYNRFFSFKGVIRSKMKIVSSFPVPHIILCNSFCLLWSTKYILRNVSQILLVPIDFHCKIKKPELSLSHCKTKHTPPVLLNVCYVFQKHSCGGNVYVSSRKMGTSTTITVKTVLLVERARVNGKKR